MTKEEYLTLQKEKFEKEVKEFENWLNSFENPPKECVCFKKPSYFYDSNPKIIKVSCPKCDCHLIYYGRNSKRYICSSCFSEFIITDEYCSTELLNNFKIY